MAKRRYKGRKKRNPFLVFLKILLLLMLTGVLAVLCIFYFGGYYDKVRVLKEEADQLVSESTKETFVPSQTGEIYDAADELISETLPEKDSNYINSDEIPDVFKKAMVSIEDKNFYKHNGVDYKAIVRAFVSTLTKRQITQGGSTITMQLARGIFLNNGRTWERKVEEIFIAWDLEKHCAGPLDDNDKKDSQKRAESKRIAKEQILEYYLNNVYFMNGYYGIASACEGYFSKRPDQLSLSQVAFLCAIPNSPTYYDPLVYPEHTIERRDLILKNMLEDGVITQEEYDEATSEEIVLDLSNNKRDDLNENTYVLSYTYKCATEILMQMEDDDFSFRYDFASDDDRELYEDIYNELYDYCLAKLYKGGYKIYTTFDMDMQDTLQECVDEELAEFEDTADDGKYKMQGAAVCIDNNTGQVVAMVGGRSQDDISGLTLNRAFQSNRQPGSSIKPLVVYTPAFERGYFPGTLVEDQEIEDGPKNAGGGYYGEMELSEAVQRSLNTVAWQIYEKITPRQGLKYLKAMHFADIVDSDNTMATCLGGFTYGVKPVEMASGYCTIQNDGKYRSPSCIRRIEDYKGEVIYTYDGRSSEIYDTNAAREMVSVLQGVLEEGWGTGRGLRLNNGMPAAGKTGTTDEAKDGWFCGFTHYYTTAVWVGCDQPEAVRNLQGATWPGRIWRNFMNAIHEGLDPVEFKDYDHAKERRALKDQDYDDDDDWGYHDSSNDDKKKEEQTKPEPEVNPVPETPVDEGGNEQGSGGDETWDGGNTDGGGDTGGGGETGGGDTGGGGETGGGDTGGGGETGGGDTGGGDVGGGEAGGA